MSSTLSEGVRVPDIGSVNWGADVNFNWGLLNTALANISGNVKTDVANTWTATQTFSETISGSIDGVAARAVNDEDGNNIKTALAGKQPSLSQSQLDAVNSGVTAAAVRQIGTNADNISSLQTAVSGKAADNAVVHLAGAETITGDKIFTGATVTHNIRPETDNTYSLGSTSYQWASVYARTYYYNGTAWGLDKYNQWTGVNDFNNLIGLNGAELWFKHPNIEDITTNPSTDVGKSILQIWNKGTTQYFGGIIDRLMTDGSHIFEIVCFGYPLNSTTPYQHRFIFAAHRDGGADFYPTYNGVVNLGTSTNKWKTLNGINPGALSLPSSSYVNIDTTGWNTTGTKFNYVAPVDGYLQIVVAANSSNLARAEIVAVFYRETSESNSGNNAMLTVPMTKGTSYEIRLTGASIVIARYAPCLGNV